MALEMALAATLSETSFAMPVWEPHRAARDTGRSRMSAVASTLGKVYPPSRNARVDRLNHPPTLDFGRLGSPGSLD